MPAERTTHSFVAAAALNLPLSSHGPAHLPSLERGKACLVCRSRKVKCDGVKPACGSCSKSAIAHGEDPTKIVCNFEEPEERSQKRKRPSPSGGKVAALEAKIAELERVIESFPATPSLSPTSDFIPQQQSHASTSYLEADVSFPPFANANRNNFDILLQATGQYQQTSFFNNVAPSHSVDYVYSFPVLSPQPVTPPDALLEIFYPGWPRDLPPPTLVHRLVDVYFTKTHATTGLINEGKFRTAMSLAPTHPGFPASALLHAMLGTASRMVSEDFFVNEDKYWGREDQAETVPDYHASRAKVAIDLALVKGDKMFHISQSIVLLCFFFYTSARFVEVWLYCGLATRIATPLGLNHIRKDSDSGPRRKKMYGPPPADDEEIYERSVVFWLSVLCDRFASASTGWAMSLADADITSLLPCPLGTPHTDDLRTSPLSPHSPNFFVAHPPHLVSTLQLYIKAVILLGRVVTYLQRSPPPIGYGTIVDPADELTGVKNLQTSKAFRKLDADAETFRLSIPRDFQRVQQRANPDSRLCLIFAVPHCATILLHEGFCTMAEGDPSFERCLTSARAILDSIYTLWSSSFEIGLLAPFVNFTWAVSGRTLVRELAIKQVKGITTGQEQIKVDVQTILAAMRAYRSPLGDVTAAALQSLLDNPERCLPDQDLRQAGMGFGEGTSADCFPPPCPFSSLDTPSESSPGGTFSSSTTAPSPAVLFRDLTAMYAGQCAPGMPVVGQGAEEARFKEMMMELPDDLTMDGVWSA